MRAFSITWRAKRLRLLAASAFLLCAWQQSAAAAEDVIRTADIFVRGYTPSDFPRVQKLAPNVYSYEQIDPTKHTITVNNLIVVTSDGVLVADGQGTVENTLHLVADIAKLTPQPIKFVIVGSEHGDHTGGNSGFPPATIFISHPTSKASLEHQAGMPGRPVNLPPIIVPTETVSKKRTLLLGGTEIDIMFLGRAHTGGDLVVYLPKEKILFTSEVFSNHVFPSMANGFPVEWVEALWLAEQMDVDMYVPAHGFVDKPDVMKDEIHRYRLALERIIAEGTRLHNRRVPLDDAPAQANFGPLDSWTRASNNAFGAIKRVYMELENQIR
jgi:glyoxylase-like metal-dependent hydrolase (beta-lactamase superfamily II)